MDWIEELLGISPDNGSGVTEALILGLLVLVLVAGLLAWQRRQDARD